tara:strand:+ start:470 stop:955 length:486 start_codon:yes stop_codon:yes gene_type:complete
MKTELELIGARAMLAIQLREHGMTYRQIGKKIRVGPQRASQIVKRACRKLREHKEGNHAVELNCRAANALSYHGINSSREAVKEAIESGVLNLKLRNYGRKTHKICCEYAGIPHHYEDKIMAEKEYQKYFSKKMLDYAANLIEAHFKRPAPLPFFDLHKNQ